MKRTGLAALRVLARCSCVGVMPASYGNQVVLDRPPHMIGRKGEGSESDTICVDACIAPEIQFLWSIGIRTTGCCCGHNDDSVFPFIGVVDEDIQRMKDMGYKVQFNRCRPNDEDSFAPMFDMTGVDRARIQAAAERRAKRNAKHKEKNDGNA